MESEGAVTQLLRRCNTGDAAAWEELIPLLYQDLRRLARQRLRLDRKALTLNTTALVHECYLRLVQNRQLGAGDRNEFLAAASVTMRRVLVDYARTRKRLKRGGNESAVPLEEVEAWLSERESEEVLYLDEALEQLKTLDARAAQVVELRFFGGLSLQETAEVLGSSVKTVQRLWITARAWLRNQIGSMA